MEDFRRRRLKKDEKSLWEQMGRNTEQPEEQVPEEPSEPEIEEENPEKFKLIKGLMKHGFGRVFKK
jgi:hypothetical protein